MSEWISVEERLPEIGSEVLTIGSHAIPWICYRTEGHKTMQWVDVCDNTYIIGITHWMPLPEPPRGE